MSAVQHAIDHMEQSNQALEETAMRDFLTGAYNRRAGEERLQSDCARAERGEGGFSLAFIDIDNLKQINDHYGHHFGDVYLQRLVAIIGAKLRRGDWIARWGGDEFVLLLWDVDMISAAEVLLRLRKIFDEESLTSETGETVRFQISAGICQHRRGWDGDTLLRCADRAVYKAKTGGKGGVVTTNGNSYTQVR
jgi:diguanylate cyclase (GGDEF)-like protein